MIEKVKEFFSKIQQKFFGKKKEEPKTAEKVAEKFDKKINTVQNEDGLHHVDQKELIQYMKDLDDKVFRDSIDKTVTKYYDLYQIEEYAFSLDLNAAYFNKYGKDEYDSNDELKNRIQKFLSDPLPELNKSSIHKKLVLDCAFGNFSIYYKEADNAFKSAEKTFDNLSKNSDKIEPQDLPLIKDLLKLTIQCSKKYSSAAIHNTKEIMKVIQYIYNNYNRDGVSVKESVDWSSIM